VAAKRVQGDQEVARLTFIALGDRHAMSKAPQYSRPPQRRDSISMSGTRRRGGDNANLHFKFRTSNSQYQITERKF
jgi:hypothetical protein